MNLMLGAIVSVVPVKVEQVVALSLGDEESYAVLLYDADEARLLPILIGKSEALAIQLEIAELSPPRPLTHDLTTKMLKAAGWKVEKIVVTDLEDDVFYARLYLKSGKKRMEFDSRPSDGIALALRFNAAVFVEEKVFRKFKDTFDLDEELEKLRPKGVTM